MHLDGNAEIYTLLNVTCHPSLQTFEIADPEQQQKELLLFIWIILATGTAAAILSWAMVL